jgi:hypothetical protein
MSEGAKTSIRIEEFNRTGFLASMVHEYSVLIMDLQSQNAALQGQLNNAGMKLMEKEEEIKALKAQLSEKPG